MIRTVLIFFITFLIGYEFFLQKGGMNEDWVKSGQSLWSLNIINAQNYLYEYEKEKYNLIIGSSIAHTLKNNYLPVNYYKLAFNGLSVYDGLLVIKKKKKLPDTLFVETNVLERPINIEFDEKIGKNELELKIKEYILCLRESSAPLSLLSQFVTSGLVVGQRKFVTNKNEKNSDSGLMISEINKKSMTPNQPDFENENKLLRDLKSLEDQNVTIVLFDMPVDCRLNKGEVYYSKLYTQAKKMGFRIIERVDCNEFITSDGTHLDNESAIKYTKYFIAQTYLE